VGIATRKDTTNPLVRSYASTCAIPLQMPQLPLKRMYGSIVGLNVTRSVGLNMQPSNSINLKARERLGSVAIVRRRVILVEPAQAVRVDLGEVSTANVYDGGRWAPSYKHNVRVKLLQPVRDYWGSECEEVNALMPIEVFNIEGHEMHEGFIATMKDRDNATSIVSPVDCDKSAFNSAHFDDKKVSSWVLQNIVDPK
jgi:hypothetical protein